MLAPVLPAKVRLVAVTIAPALTRRAIDMLFCNRQLVSVTLDPWIKRPTPGLLLNDRLSAESIPEPRMVSAGSARTGLRMPSSDGLVVPLSITSLSRMTTFSTQMPTDVDLHRPAFASIAGCTRCPALQSTVTMLSGRGKACGSGGSGNQAGVSACAAAAANRQTNPRNLCMSFLPFV